MYSSTIGFFDLVTIKLRLAIRWVHHFKVPIKLNIWNFEQNESFYWGKKCNFNNDYWFLKAVVLRRNKQACGQYTWRNDHRSIEKVSCHVQARKKKVCVCVCVCVCVRGEGGEEINEKWYNAQAEVSQYISCSPIISSPIVSSYFTCLSYTSFFFQNTRILISSDHHVLV